MPKPFLPKRHRLCTPCCYTCGLPLAHGCAHGGTGMDARTRAELRAAGFVDVREVKR